MATNPNMVAIQTVTVGSGGAASIEFTNIPQTYTDLALVISARNTNNNGSDNMLIAINDSSANFSGRFLFTNTNGTISSGTDTTQSGAYNGGETTANTFSNVSIYFPNYAGSTNKSFSVDSVAENNGTTSNLYFDAKLWSNTAAITKMAFTCTSGNFAQYSTATLYGVTSAGYGAKATGGIITQDANYFYHTFLSSGTFTPTSNITADYLVVAGGGGGGSEGGGGGGGGLRSTVTATGGGGSLESALSLTANSNYTVTVGAGGTAGTSGTSGGNGSDSVFSTITSTGGGGGGAKGQSGANQSGKSGGSGGGASRDAGVSTGGAGTANQGYAGGGANGTGDTNAGGGGGAGAVGQSAQNPGSSGPAGNGGAGVSVSIAGSSLGYAGGGGGGALNNQTRGTATDGGGAGGNNSNASTSGTVNRGGGGGGGGFGDPTPGKLNGSAGGSGIVIVRYAK